MTVANHRARNGAAAMLVVVSAVFAASPADAAGPFRPAFAAQASTVSPEAPPRKGLSARRHAERALRRAQRASCDREAREMRLSFFWRQRFVRMCVRGKR